jgi:hypothetical protein
MKISSLQQAIAVLASLEAKLQQALMTGWKIANTFLILMSL